jgi:hypothetical protein
MYTVKSNAGVAVKILKLVMKLMLHHYYFFKCINKLPIHLPEFQPFTSMTASIASMKLPSSNTGLLPPTNYAITQLPTFSPPHRI